MRSIGLPVVSGLLIALFVGHSWLSQLSSEQPTAAPTMDATWAAEFSEPGGPPKTYDGQGWGGEWDSSIRLEKRPKGAADVHLRLRSENFRAEIVAFGPYLSDEDLIRSANTSRTDPGTSVMDEPGIALRDDGSEVKFQSENHAYVMHVGTVIIFNEWWVLEDGTLIYLWIRGPEPAEFNGVYDEFQLIRNGIYFTKDDFSDDESPFPDMDD